MPKNGAGFVILAAIAAGIVFAVQNANANGELPMGADDGTNSTDDSSMGTGDFVMPDLSNATVDQIRSAVLYMVRSCEHTGAAVASGQDYQTFYGGTLFWDMSDHPCNTGELQGVPLPSQVCINAGFADGVCVSTAAGGYQITKPTWKDFRGTPGNADYLPDFTPESQDAAALRIMAKIGALPLIDAGNITAAIPVLGKRWASLPGAVGKQGQRSLAFVMSKFNEGLQA